MKYTRAAVANQVGRHTSRKAGISSIKIIFVCVFI